MADKTIDFNALQQVIDTSWGHSSTPAAASYSVKIQIQNVDHLQVLFSSMVQVGGYNDRVNVQRLCAEQSVSMIKEVLTVVKKAYKELTGDTLKLKEVQSNDSLEVVGGFSGVKQPRMSALYRRKTILEIG